MLDEQWVFEFDPKDSQNGESLPVTGGELNKEQSESEGSKTRVGTVTRETIIRLIDVLEHM